MRKYVLTGAVVTSVISLAVGVARMAGVSIPLTDEQIATLGNAVAGIGGIVLSLLVASASGKSSSADVDRVGAPAEGVGREPARPDSEASVGSVPPAVRNVDPFRDHGA